MKNNFTKIFLYFSVILFLLLTAVFVFLYVKIQNNNQNAATSEATWKAEDIKQKETSDLKKLLNQNAASDAILETHFAKHSDVVPFFDAMDKVLAPKAGAVAKIVSVDTGTDNKQMIVSLKATGSFASVYKFLTLLENSPYELDFVSVNMLSLSDGSTAPIVPSLGWEADFKIRLISYIPS